MTRIPQARVLDPSIFGPPPATVAERRASRRRAHDISRMAKCEVARHVYFVGAPNDLVKIGSAFDVELRLGELRTMSPVPLHLIAYATVGGDQKLGHLGARFERALHRHFEGDRAHGEWFHVDLRMIRTAVDQARDAGWPVELIEITEGGDVARR